MPVLFKDLYKPQKDFFNKNFNDAPFRAEFKVKDLKEVKLSPVFELRDGKSFQSTEVELDLKTSYDVTSKVLVTSKNRGKLDTTMKMFEGKNLELNASYDHGFDKSDSDVLAVQADWNKDANRVVAAVTSASSGTKFDFAYTGETKVQDYDCLVGANASLSPEGKVSAWTAGFRASQGKTSVAALYTHAGALSVGALFAVEKGLVAAEVKQSKGKMSYLFGCQSAIGSSTYKAKAGLNGVVGVSVLHKINKNLSAALSGDFDVPKQSLGKVGLKLLWE